MVLRGRPGTLQERSARRVQWQPPEGVSIVAEYWFPTDDPSVVAIVEAEDVGAVTPLRMTWDDLFDMDIFPVLTGEEGLEMLRQRMAAQG